MKTRFIYLNGWMRIRHVIAVGRVETIQCVRSASFTGAIEARDSVKRWIYKPYTDRSLLLLNSSSPYFKLQKRTPRSHVLSSFPRCSSQKRLLRGSCACHLPSKGQNQRNEKHDARLHDLLSLSVFYSPKRQLRLMHSRSSCRKTIRQDTWH
jgi:hypothetical protein